MEPLPISIEGRDLRTALTTESGLNALLSLDVDGDPHLALAREIQRHPVRHTVTHVDFQIVRRDEIVSAEVPITLIGESVQVSQNQGVVEQPLISLTVQATPGRIPNSIEVDISALAIGDTIRVADLPLPDGVTTDIDGEEAVVIAQGSAVAAQVAADQELTPAAPEEAPDAAADEAPEA
jgi:large subunit ribosomal protein L25